MGNAAGLIGLQQRPLRLQPDRAARIEPDAVRRLQLAGLLAGAAAMDAPKSAATSAPPASSAVRLFTNPPITASKCLTEAAMHIGCHRFQRLLSHSLAQSENFSIAAPISASLLR